MWNRLRMSHGDNFVNTKLLNEDDCTKIVLEIIALQRFYENCLRIVIIPRWFLENHLKRLSF